MEGYRDKMKSNLPGGSGITWDYGEYRKVRLGIPNVESADHRSVA